MVAPKRKALFYSQLATMIESGLSYIEVFAMLGNKSLGSDLGKAARVIKDELVDGIPLQDCLERQRHVFSTFELGLLTIGIESGNVTDQLRLLEKWFTNIQKFHWEIRRNLSFPFFLLALAYLVTRAKIFFLEGWDAFFWQGLWPVMIGVAGILLIYLILDWMFGEAGVEQAVGLHLPFVRKSIKKIMVARFLRAYGAMTAAGVPFQTALELARESAGSGFLKTPVEKILSVVDRGGTMAEGFAATQVFPIAVQQMLSTGERTGNLPDMAERAATMLEGEAEARLRDTFKIFSLLFYLSVVAWIVYEVFVHWAEHLDKITDLDQ